MRERYWVDLVAFATSPHGLGIPEERFWRMSFMEYRAQEKVWSNANRERKYQWANLMATLYNSHLRASGHPAYSPYDWMPGEDRPEEKPPWVVDVNKQRLSIRQMLSFAAEYNEAKKQQVN